MIDRLALAIACGFIGYTIARERHRNEGREHFDALMGTLPLCIVDAIDAHIRGEPLLTQSIREDV